MVLTLTLAAGLLAAPEPQAEPAKDWIIEVRGFTKHPQAKPEGWAIELQGFTKHRKQAEAPKGFIIEFLWPQAKPEGWIIEVRGFHKHRQAKPQIEPVESQYYDDLSAFFEQFKVQVEPIETQYHDNLSAFFEQLKKR
jgi:hypothetical protein